MRQETKRRRGRRKSKNRMHERKTPMRRCVGCMTSFPKKEIVRLVAIDGKLAIDKTGKLNGRGAYLCRSLECFDTAMKKKRLNYAIGAQMTAEETAVFRAEFSNEILGAEVNE